tara:strand:+ start:210 stop:710 length:501 start_codon:yes stop_codon:yes gene_type:complete
VVVRLGVRDVPSLHAMRDVEAGLDCLLTGRCPHRWGNNFHMDLVGHLLGYKAKTATEAVPAPAPAPADDDASSSDDEDEDEYRRFAVWMGCSICYIFLTDPLYDQLSDKLLAPHYSLDLNDVEVGELIYKAYKECEVVGDVEFLEDSYFAGKDFFDCPKTWRGGSA